ncbi:MAG TPA: c-type cytochrome biogenesis protein CcmI, partial [Candidatus Binatia bacterium]|nr:c-type cytochrome biogenesis protein CcmI [Candidatus Binatia bacterium]
AEITLGDEDSPMPARKLSSVGEWRVVARISRAGGAQAASGDLQGERRIARAQAGKPIAITIDRRIE